MKIAISNRQKAAGIDRGRIRVLTRSLLHRAGPPDPEGAWGDISVVTADDAVMRDVNRRYLRCDAPTDVLSFRYPPLPGEAEEAGGELFVNVQRALERAPRAPSRELALYLAHACDHLAGHDDADDAARRRMRRRELRWLRELGAACEGLLRH